MESVIHYRLAFIILWGLYRERERFRAHGHAIWHGKNHKVFTLNCFMEFKIQLNLNFPFTSWLINEMQMLRGGQNNQTI